MAVALGPRGVSGVAGRLARLSRRALPRARGAPARYVLTTLPRSGTHWLKAMLSDLIGEPPLEARLLDGARGAALERALSRHAPHRLVYDHLDHDLHASLLSPERRPGLRLLALHRHPADHLVSTFHFAYARGGLFYDPEREAWTRTPRPDPMADLRGFVRSREWPRRIGVSLVSGPRHGFVPFRDYLRRLAVAWKEHPGALAVRYEDLVAAPEETLARAAAHWGLAPSDAAVEAAVARHRFERTTGGRRRGVEDRAAHNRRGLPGEWREVLDAADQRRVAAHLGDLLARLGYEA